MDQRWCFDPGPEDPARPPGRAPALGGETSAAAPRFLACAGCRRRITSGAAKIEVAGAHEHTFENPGGFVFRIGCFAFAEGLVPFGAPSSHWSWFPGMTWQVQHCAACRLHLGWRFASSDAGFYGLILQTLVEIDEPS